MEELQILLGLQEEINQVEDLQAFQVEDQLAYPEVDLQAFQDQQAFQGMEERRLGDLMLMAQLDLAKYVLNLEWEQVYFFVN